MIRVQRLRTKGWRMPEGAVYVGRPSLWGNPWSICDAPTWFDRAERPAWVVERYREELQHLGLLSDYYYIVSDARWEALSRAIDDSGAKNMAEYAAIALRGKTLVCWCPLEDVNGNRVPCHADVLLELAR